MESQNIGDKYTGTENVGFVAHSSLRLFFLLSSHVLRLQILSITHSRIFNFYLPVNSVQSVNLHRKSGEPLVSRHLFFALSSLGSKHRLLLSTGVRWSRAPYSKYRGPLRHSWGDKWGLNGRQWVFLSLQTPLGRLLRSISNTSSAVETDRQVSVRGSQTQIL